MKKILKAVIATLVCLVLTQTIALASSHREAPLISNDPLADNTDVYAFKSPENPDKIILIANYIPFEHPAGGPNWYTFGENIRYEIHVENNGVAGDDILYRFTFRQLYQDSSTFFRIRTAGAGGENLKTFYNLERSINGGAFSTIVTNGVVPPPNIGPRSIENATVGLGAPTYESLWQSAITTSTTGERVFAGPIDDPFFVDLGGAFDLGNFRTPGRDGLAKFNCHSLVLEVPVATLHKESKTVSQAVNILDSSYIIGVYASASRRQITTFDSTTGNETASGDWVQVSRLGMPLTNEVIIPVPFKDKWNATMTGNEAEFYPYFKNPELALYMDTSKFGNAVPGLSKLRIQQKSLASTSNPSGFDFRNGKPGLFPVRGTPGVAGTALDEPANGGFAHILLPDNMSPRAVDLLPIFFTGVPNLRPYQLATGKGGNPLAAGKPFINNFLPTFGDMLRLNMAVPVTPRNDPNFSSLGLVQAAVLGLTNATYANPALQFIPNMDGFPNGRRLEDDVTTIELQAVGGVVLAAIGLWYDDYNANDPNASPVTPQLGNVLSFNAGVTTNDTMYRTSFPFVQTPWRGFTGAQYVGPKSQDPLPVNFVKFTAEKSGQGVLLRWQVTNEVNNDRYEVEQGVDGRRFTKIGTVTASRGNSNSYELFHPTPDMQAVNYYRIRQIDKDGRITLSVVRLIRFNANNILTITPNPATDFIRVYSTKTRVNIYIVDGAGKRVASQVITDGNAEFNISQFARGTYIVVAESDGVRLETKKIVKQ